MIFTIDAEVTKTLPTYLKHDWIVNLQNVFQYWKHRMCNYCTTYYFSQVHYYIKA